METSKRVSTVKRLVAVTLLSVGLGLGVLPASEAGANPPQCTLVNYNWVQTAKYPANFTPGPGFWPVPGDAGHGVATFWRNQTASCNYEAGWLVVWYQGWKTYWPINWGGAAQCGCWA